MGSILSCCNGGGNETSEDELSEWRSDVSTRYGRRGQNRRNNNNNKRNPRSTSAPSRPISTSFSAQAFMTKEQQTQTFCPQIQKRSIGIQANGPEEEEEKENVSSASNLKKNARKKHARKSNTNNHVQIEMLMKEPAFKKLKFNETDIGDQTYLITIPLDKSSFVNRFHEFKKAVVNTTIFNGKTYERMFNNPKTLHITLAILNIRTSEEAKFASRILENEFNRFESKFAFKLDISELVTWEDENSDKSRTICIRIYDEKLQEIAEHISESFHRAGFLAKNHPNQALKPVRLHVTLINAKRAGYSPGGNGAKSFDSNPVLKNFKTWTFKDVVLDDIQLNNSGLINQNGYYFSEYSYKNDYLTQ